MYIYIYVYIYLYTHARSSLRNEGDVSRFLSRLRETRVFVLVTASTFPSPIP